MARAKDASRVTDVEKQGEVALSAEGSSKPDTQHHQYAARAKERLKHFVHPSGKRVHVALSPEQAVTLRQKLEKVQSDEDFDVVLSGTKEHLEFLRTTQDHHATRRNELRDRHKEVFEHITNVNHEIAAIANELDRVTTHGVSLEAHFGRFGYDAHVRSYDEDEHESGTTTPRSSTSGESREKSASYEKGFATPLKLFKTPVVRQYFHKGILWRASGAEEVQSFELFVDLLYVGIIAINGDATSEDPTGLSLLRFVITFTLSYKIWNDMSLFISWFETDDVFQRVSVLFLLTCLFGYTTNITHAFDEQGTYATLIGFYVAARLFMSSYLLLIAWIVPMVRPIMIFHAITIICAASIWIGSIHTDWPNQLALIWIAIFIDVTGSVSHLFMRFVLGTISASHGRWFDKTFEYFPAINIEHRTERTNAFVTLVFGYTVVAILYQSVINGIDGFFGKAILGLIQCFVYNWLYFEVDGSNLSKHAIRRHRLSAFAWSMAHLPFIMAFVLAGGALSRLVVAHDCPDTNVFNLSEAYQDRSEEEISVGIRWFYSAGLGVALIMMAIISMSHIHRDIDGLRLSKKHRLIGRFAVAIVLILLPLAEELNSLNLVGIITALLVFLLALELWATSCCHEALIGRSKQCRYVGMTGRRNVQALVGESGSNLNIDDFVQDKERSGPSVFS